MKHLFLSIVTLITITSCSKKDYTCNCKVNGDDYQKNISKTTKSKANSQCSDYGKQIGENYYYGNYAYKCTVN